MTGTAFAILAMFLFIYRLFKLIFFHIHRIFSIDRIFPIDRILSTDRYFSINIIISINRIFAINRIFFILAYSEKRKYKKQTTLQSNALTLNGRQAPSRETTTVYN